MVDLDKEPPGWIVYTLLVLIMIAAIATSFYAVATNERMDIQAEHDRCEMIAINDRQRMAGVPLNKRDGRPAHTPEEREFCHAKQMD